MNEYYNHWIASLFNVVGIVLFENIYYAIPKEQVSDRLRRHEKEHVRQQKEEGPVRFKIKYFFEYISNLIKYRNKWIFNIKKPIKYFKDLHQIAYWNISYEIKAVEAEFKNIQERRNEGPDYDKQLDKAQD